MSDPLELFHPLVSSWFSRRYGRPTPIQSAAWPRIRSGENVLITAPTGSGKTLTAFLSALDDLIAGRKAGAATTTLYISPMKALNNDIQRNLVNPLEELSAVFAEAGEKFPDITVATRSGDTPSAERQRMVRRPPEILITTPESLNIILTSPKARAMLADVQTVILDEIHAVVGSKRGTHLMSAVERLALYAGEFQRIAVSATVRPLEVVAEFVGGQQLIRRTDSRPDERSEDQPRTDTEFAPRPVSIVRSESTKVIRLTVDIPEEPSAPGETMWDALVPKLLEIIERNRSTLIFVTTRTHAEKLTLLLNEGRDEPLAYSHHGSLARELRYFVEQSLKAGRLKAIVATNSLELGIDIGDLDEVVLVRTPPEVAATLQRVGRAGHRVGEPSIGTLFPLNGHDILSATVMTSAVLEQEIEPVTPVREPLDVLAQILVSMVSVDPWDVDDLYDAVRSCAAYMDLDRKLFDLVLEMLAGRFAQIRIRELRPRVSIDPVTRTVTAASGAQMLLYRSGGTIPDRGYYGLRVVGGGKVGELDEEFVWERRVGQSFVLGSQLWKITEINDRDVVVVPGSPSDAITPFWIADPQSRSLHYSMMFVDFLEQCERAARDGQLERLVESRDYLTVESRRALCDYLEAQRFATGTSLPHRHQIVVESFYPGPAQRGGRELDGIGLQVVVHCPWGGTVTRPLAIALAVLFRRSMGFEPDVFANNDCITFLLPEGIAPGEVFSRSICNTLSGPGAIEELLREGLEPSAMFGTLFRENAGRALLLPRGGFNTRMPLWLNRLRSRKLMDAIAACPDFPVLLETWRECLQDRFNLDAIRDLMVEVSSGEIAVTEAHTDFPSPFSAEVVWLQVNTQLYGDDSGRGSSSSSLSDDLIRQVARDESLRPMIPAAVINEVELRLQRLKPGYAPSTPGELADWVSERLALTEEDAARLNEAMGRDSAAAAEDGATTQATATDGNTTDAAQATSGADWTSACARLCWIRTTEGKPLLAALDRLPALCDLLGLEPDSVSSPVSEQWSVPPSEWRLGDGARRAVEAALAVDPPPDVEVVAEWLRFFGPHSTDFPREQLGIAQYRWDQILEDMEDADTLVTGRISEDSTEVEICEAETLEYLLRLKRKEERPLFTAVDQERLVPYLARRTHLAGRGSDPDALVSVLDTLFGYPAPAASWECDILPARIDPYYPVWLDGLFKESGLLWLGCGAQRATLSVEDEIDLFTDGSAPDGLDESICPRVLEALRTNGALGFGELRMRLDISGDALSDALWRLAWSGAVTNTSFETLRRGILSGFAPQRSEERTAHRAWPGRRTGRPVRPPIRPVEGSWFALPEQASPDPLSLIEDEKERARTLLRRYGIVFRRMLDREMPTLHWSRLFRALRLMELGGEVVAGSFIQGVDVPQFALRSALTEIANPEPAGIYWMSAIDPVSPCGLGLDHAYPELPARIASNHLVFRDGKLVMTSQRHGADLSLHIAPDDPDLRQILAPLFAMAGRSWNPRTRVSIETVNGVAVRDSEFAEALKQTGFRDEFRSYVLHAGYR